MRSEVTVKLADGAELRFDLDEVQPMPHDVARWWLDDQFTRLGCEPLRATGKVLIADKVLCVGLNYMTHIKEGGREPPTKPIIFTRFIARLAR